MLSLVLYAGLFLAGGAVGFGAGRVKNAAKLAAVKAEIAKVEGVLTADYALVVAKIKAKL